MKTLFTSVIIAATIFLYSCRAHRIRLENADGSACNVAENMKINVKKLSLGGGIVLVGNNKAIDIQCGRLIVNNPCTISASGSVRGNTLTISFAKCSGRKKIALQLGDNYFNMTQTNK